MKRRNNLKIELISLSICALLTLSLLLFLPMQADAAPILESKEKPLSFIFDTQQLGTGQSHTLALYGNVAQMMDAEGSEDTAVLGSGCWKATPSVDTNGDGADKFQFYMYWKDAGTPVDSYLGSFTIANIDHISYHTNKPTSENDPDFYVHIYTTTDGTDDNGWYGYRLTAEPYFSNNLNAPANQWNEWHTDDGTNQLTFFDSWKTGTYGFYGQPDLQDLQSGSINWQTDYGYGIDQSIDYGSETVLGISYSTGSGWSDVFDGYLDALEIALTDGTKVTIDLEQFSDTITPTLGYLSGADSRGGVRYKTFDSSNDAEAYIGSDLDDPSARAELDFYGATDIYGNTVYASWQSTNHIQLTYDPRGSLYTKINCSHVLEKDYSCGYLGDDLNYLQFTVAARQSGTTVNFENVILYNQTSYISLGDFINIDDDWKDWYTLFSSGSCLKDGFTIEGDIVLSGSQPGGETNKVQIIIGHADPPCGPEVWVDDDADASWYDYYHVHTVQEGIDHVCDGGTVYVYEGTYNPSSMITIDKSVTILGPQAGVDPRPFNTSIRSPSDSSEAVVDAGGLLGTIVYVAADDVTIDGLEITDGTDDLMYSSSPAIENTMVTNCIIHGSTGDEGIQLKNCQFGSIHRNYIFDVAQDGANFGYSQSCELSENEITTSDSENAAIFVYESSDILISKNYVHETTAANGIELYQNNGDIEVINNLVVDNEWMIKSKHHDYSGNAILGYKYTETGNTVTIAHNTLSNNKVSDSSPYHANEIGFGNGIGINTVIDYSGLHYDGFLTIKNNIISDNGLPSYGYALITKEYYGCPGPTPANCIIEYNDIYNNGAGSCLGTFCPVDTMTNIFVDPLFVSLGSDYQLQFASPCRDSATSLGILDDIINNARDSTPDRGAYEYIITCAPEVWVDDDADSSWYDFTHVHTVQEGIDHVCPGGTVYVEEGIYNENVVVDKHLKMIGSGSDSFGSIITQDTAGAGDSHVGVIQITASGLSETDSLLFQDLRVEPIGLAGFSIGRFCEATATSVEYVTLDNVYVIGTNTDPSTEQERGLYVDLTSSLSYLSVVDSTFSNLTYGWYLQKQVSADSSTVDHVTVINTQFNHNNHKGIYAEKLSDATFTDCIIQNNGFDSSALPSYFAPWSAGVDFNLKAGTYQDFVFESCIFEDNAIDEAKEGVALTVKERGTGLDTSYSSFPAHVDDVFVYDCIFTNNERGIRFGEPGKDNIGPTNVVVKCCIIEGNEQQYSGSDGSTYGGLINAMQSLVLAEDNYWGDCSGPGGEGPGAGDAVSTNVDFDPWGGVVADAGGPYDADPGEIIQFDSSGSCYCPTAVVDYFWDFGDGYSGPEQYLENPTHSYTGESDKFVVHLTITVTGDSCSWSDSISTTVTIGDDDPPIIQLISPEDGDNVNGVVTVEWYAIDDSYPPAQIYLYYKPSDAGSDAWRQINDVLTNNIDTEHGSYDWDTSGFADGEYDLLAEALDNDDNIAHHSIMINIGNGNSG
ncbi:MAG: right-handed parallel beta-helix repeat-containing protein, partial [Candidatus Thermoplasmatota archaeon]|nr:right-handed parallel beta-helix repeat-containing protein [Candidatus Thermoplasmatota archaeon]